MSSEYVVLFERISFLQLLCIDVWLWEMMMNLHYDDVNLRYLIA